MVAALVAVVPVPVLPARTALEECAWRERGELGRTKVTTPARQYHLLRGTPWAPFDVPSCLTDAERVAAKSRDLTVHLGLAYLPLGRHIVLR
jgi:hypothetical protein